MKKTIDVLHGMKAEKVNVNFYDCEYGWLRLKISAGEQYANLSFSHSYDPLPDLKCWLEAIAIGVEQTSFSYNPEGDIIKFDFLEMAYGYRGTENYDRMIRVFSLSFPFYALGNYNVTSEMIMSNKTIPNEQDEIFFKAWIDRKQLVEAFYNGLTSFYLSDNYKKEEWEYQSFDNVLCEKLKLNHIQLVSYLLSISERDFRVLLSENDKADVWNLSNDFELMQTEDKINEIEEILKCNTSPWYGTSLNEFRSGIIENFLKDSIDYE